MEAALNLYDRQVPQLQAGEYVVEANLDMGSQAITEELKADRLKVRVSGPRFFLSEDDVKEYYPPSKASGNFSFILPHIVFNKRVLPWERILDDEASSLPWMALLVFEEGELIGGAASDTQIETMTVEMLLSDSDVNILKPDINLKNVPIHERSMKCSSISFSGDLFDCIVPKWATIKMLPHVREVDLTNKAFLPLEEGQFAVLPSHRLPSKPMGRKVIVHLVSLEGWNDYLKPDSQMKAAGKKVRMVSLHNWSFINAEEKGRFSDVMCKMAEDSNRYLILPTGQIDPCAPEEVCKRTEAGYVPKYYKTLSGEHTFAWYRGPLTKRKIGLTAKSDPFRTSSGAMIYDELNGVFDLSYSAAWELGRKLARADKSFSTRLLKVRQNTIRIADKLLKQQQNGWMSTAFLDPNFACPTEDCGRVEKQIVQHVIGLGDSALFQKIHSVMTGQLPKEPQREPERKMEPEGVAKNFEQFNVRQRTQEQWWEHAMLQLSSEWEPISKWLGDLLLFKNIPLPYLVPDWRMLPTDSIRFFRVDANWTHALMDGALSIGFQSTLDYQMLGVIRKKLIEQAYWLSAQERPKLFGRPIVERSQYNYKERTGFLMRSSLVDKLEGMTIKVAPGSNEEATILLTEKIQPTLLFCLIEGVPSSIEIAEPQESLRFGAENDKLLLDYRSLDTGSQGQDLGDISLPIDPQYRTVLLQDLVKELLAKLNRQELSPAELGLQLYNLSDRMMFDLAW